MKSDDQSAEQLDYNVNRAVDKMSSAYAIRIQRPGLDDGMNCSYHKLESKSPFRLHLGSTTTIKYSSTEILRFGLTSSMILAGTTLNDVDYRNFTCISKHDYEQIKSAIKILDRHGKQF